MLGESFGPVGFDAEFVKTAERSQMALMNEIALNLDWRRGVVMTIPGGDCVGLLRRDR